MAVPPEVVMKNLMTLVDEAEAEIDEKLKEFSSNPEIQEVEIRFFNGRRTDDIGERSLYKELERRYLDAGWKKVSGWYVYNAGEPYWRILLSSIPVSEDTPQGGNDREIEAGPPTTSS